MWAVHTSLKLRRSLLIQALTLISVLFSQARAEAKELDDEYALTGKIRGPLHGVPVSFKDICAAVLCFSPDDLEPDMLWGAFVVQMTFGAVTPRWATHPTPTNPQQRTLM